MEELIENPLTTVGLAALLVILVQLGKELLPSEKDADGKEVGPRRWLPLAVIGLGILIGAGFGVALAYADQRVMGVLEWCLRGVIFGAMSLGLYAGGKALAPQIFTNRGWLGG